MRTLWACVVVALALAGLQAQERQAVTVAGCVEQAQRTGSLADDTGAGTAATPSTAAIEANRAEPVDAYLLTNATPARPEEADTPPTTYTLQGHADELATHKGHRVEITGWQLPAASFDRTPPTNPIATGIRRIIVDSVKMVSPECPAKTP
jgi:hypothetical protein